VDKLLISTLLVSGHPARVYRFLEAIKIEYNMFVSNRIKPIPNARSQVASGYMIVDSRKDKEWYQCDLHHERTHSSASTPEGELQVQDYGSWFDGILAEWASHYQVLDLKIKKRIATFGVTAISPKFPWSPAYPFVIRLEELFPEIAFEIDWEELSDPIDYYLVDYLFGRLHDLNGKQGRSFCLGGVSTQTLKEPIAEPPDFPDYPHPY
jgi:hypothetical protein